jgi:branched-chain amino acid transport system substrate-binding protein
MKSASGTKAAIRMNIKSAIAAMALALCAGPVAAQTVKVGLISTFSGPEAGLGERMDRGVKLYQKLHADKLPPGVKVEVITRDDGGPNPDKAKQLAQELIVRDRVNFLTGVVWTPNAMAIAPLTAESKTPFLIMNAAASVITTRSPYITRFASTIWQAALPMGEWAAKKGYKRAYIAVTDFSPGHDTEEAFDKGFSGPGREIVGKVRMPLANPDFVPFMQRVKDAKPDVLFYFVPGGRQSTAFVKAYQELGLEKAGIKLISSTVVLDEELPESSLGMISVYHYTTSADRPSNKAFVAAFRKEFGINPEYIAVAAYDAMDAIYQAVREQKGNVDADRTMEILKNYKNANSPRGPISIDPATRDIVQNMYLREVRKVGGQLMSVETETVGYAVKDPWKELNRK